MDAESRNTMLIMLKENLINNNNRSIFVVNHAEMIDDYFDHKIKVRLENKKINIPKKRKNDVDKIALCHASKYEFVF